MMRKVRANRNGARKVSATVSSPDDIHAATVTIALHHDSIPTDVFVAATWTTTPVLSGGLWTGVAETSAVVDFSTLPLGNNTVRAKAGTSPSVDCYIIRVVP